MTIRIYTHGKETLVLIDARAVLMFRPKQCKFKELKNCSEQTAMRALREEGWARQHTYKVDDAREKNWMFNTPLANHLAAALFGDYRQQSDILDAEILEE